MSTVKVNGLTAVQDMFVTAKSARRSAFLPYFPIGYPDIETSLTIIQGMADAGVDGFEIGMPFSDPLADGPVIQAATQQALKNGVTVKACLGAVEELRRRGVNQPMFLMGYLNPILSYGVEAFMQDAASAGGAGVIIPDLPPEEAADSIAACQTNGLGHVFFLAPTSNPQRIERVNHHATGFIYLVSLMGVTGARAELAPDLKDFITRIKKQTTQPLVLGFGIGTPEHVRSINNMVDGFIVGSALVKAAGDGVDAVSTLAINLRRALDDPAP